MRIISYHKVVETISELVQKVNCILPADVIEAINSSRIYEKNHSAGMIIDQIIENAEIAKNEMIPVCQDTGTAVFFVEIGSDVKVEAPGLASAINEGVRIGYRDGYLRKSITGDPLLRKNTGDNTPSVIHYTYNDNDVLKITFCPKGAGCENMSKITMLSPGDGRDGVINFVKETVKAAGGRPCPPIILGIGLGGNFEYSAILSKKALLRKIGDRNQNEYYANLECELLEILNAIGIGPMGLGGNTTVLDVFIETAPCHIASLPLAVNIQCHAARHGEVIF